MPKIQLHDPQLLAEWGEDFALITTPPPWGRGGRPPWKVWRAKLAMLLQRPVGARMAEEWRWEGDREDARPARELWSAGVSPQTAEKIYECARTYHLWGGGYGSPYSPSALLILKGLGAGWSPREVRTIHGVFGHVSRWPKDAVAIAHCSQRIGGSVRRIRGAFQHPPVKLAKLVCIVARRPEFREKAHLAAIGVMLDYLRAVEEELYAGSPNWAELFHAQMSRPTRELRAEYGSPRSLWRQLGVRVYWGVRTVPPPGTPGATVRALVARVGGSMNNGEVDDAELRPITVLLRLFGRQAPRYVDVTGQSVHDAGQLIPPPEDAQGAGEYLLRHLKVLQEVRSLDFDLRRRRKDEVRAIVGNWVPEMAQLSWSQAVTRARVATYEGLPQRVAEVAAELDLNQYRAEQYAAWLERHAPKAGESIPGVTVTSEDAGCDGEWRMYRLRHDDVRGPLLGLYTDCCQHPDGAGSECAAHGWRSALGAFYVVEYNDQIVAQSWAWRSGDVVVFDNIETLGVAHRESILKMYLVCAQRMLGQLEVKAVHVGVGYSDGLVDGLPEVAPVAPEDYSGYRDSHEQRLMAVTP